MSRRTIGRLADLDLTMALRDPQELEAARTCLAETISRGSTAEERDAAVAWLEDAARSEHPVARKPSAATPPDAVRWTRRSITIDAMMGAVVGKTPL